MKHIVSFSGGKDSTAMLLLMLEHNMKIDEIVFADTLLEFPEMYEYIAKVEQVINRKITILKPKTTFFKWFYGKPTRGKNMGTMRGFPPVTSHCYWSREVKEYGLKKYTYGNIVYLGIAYDEPKRIKEHPHFKAIYPLYDWCITEKECIKYLKDRGLHNPLYNKFSRTGCWLCPKQNLKSLKIMWKDYPLYWRIIKIMDEESKGCKFRLDYTVQQLEDRFVKENNIVQNMEFQYDVNSK